MTAAALKHKVGGDSVTLQGYNYARIDKELKLDLCNNKAIEIDAEITLHLGGKVDEVTDDGEVVLTGFNAADWVQ